MSVLVEWQSSSRPSPPGRPEYPNCKPLTMFKSCHSLTLAQSASRQRTAPAQPKRSPNRSSLGGFPCSRSYFARTWTFKQVAPGNSDCKTWNTKQVSKSWLPQNFETVSIITRLARQVCGIFILVQGRLKRKATGTNLKCEWKLVQKAACQVRPSLRPWSSQATTLLQFICNKSWIDLQSDD